MEIFVSLKRAPESAVTVNDLSEIFRATMTGRVIQAKQPFQFVFFTDRGMLIARWDMEAVILPGESLSFPPEKTPWNITTA